MNPAIAKNAIEFMRRSQISGGEVFAFVECIQALEKIIIDNGEAPPANPPAPSGNPTAPLS